MNCRNIFVTVTLIWFLPSFASSQERWTLNETFPSGMRTTIELRTELEGRLTLPAAKKGEPPQRVTMTGRGMLHYDEHQLPADGDTQKVLRQYRTVEFQRRIDQQEQEAGLRPEVRRVVVLRSPTNGKSPFSPDGPLTWSEIDTIRTDVFCPTLVTGLLPKKPVGVGDIWSIDTAAVEELTDMDKVTAGGFTMKLVGLVTVMGRQQVRMSLSGTANGIDEHGPCKHTLDGTAYYDLTAKRLSYLSLKGTHELLDGSGKSSGTIEGRFTLTRSDSSADAVSSVETSPTTENSLLLYNNPDFGVKFLYPRRWRVGAIQGRQLTLDGPNNSGILLTMETPKQLPTAEAYLNETIAFLRKEKASPKLHAKPSRFVEKVDRFAFDAELGGEKVRMEYAVVAGRVGGATLAARLPLADAAPLTGDWERLLKSLTLLK